VSEVPLYSTCIKGFLDRPNARQCCMHCRDSGGFLRIRQRKLGKGRSEQPFIARCVVGHSNLPGQCRANGSNECRVLRVNGSNAKPMAPTCAESSEPMAPMPSQWLQRVPSPQSPVPTSLLGSFTLHSPPLLTTNQPHLHDSRPPTLVMHGGCSV